MSGSMETLVGFDARTMRLMGGDRYLYFEVYKKRDVYAPEYFTCVLDTLRHLPLPFTPDSKVIAFSSSGRYGLVVEPYYRSDRKLTALSGKEKTADEIDLTSPSGNEIATQTGEVGDNEVTTIQVASLHDLETGAKQSLSVLALSSQSFNVTSGGFSPDEKFIVCHTSQGLTFAFLVERGKYMYKWGEEDKMGFMSQTTAPVPSTILPKNYLVQAGLGYEQRSTLYVRNLNNGDTIRELRCGGYDIGELIVNDANTLMATCSGEDGYSSSKGSDKDLYVWDIERGELVSRCSNKDAVNSICFLGEQDEFLLVCPRHSSVVQVWYTGTIKHACSQAILIHNLIGHSDDVLTLDYSPKAPLLITSSKDNTVKFWSIERILTRCGAIVKKAGKGFAEDLQMLRESMMYDAKCSPCTPTEQSVKTTSMALSKNNKVAAVGTSQGWVLIFDVEMQDKLAEKLVSSEMKPVACLLTSSDGKYFISGGRDQTINFFDTETGAHVREIQPIKPIDVMTEAAGVLVCGQGGMECYGVCYEVETGKHMCTLEGLYGFGQVCITSDGKKVVSTLFDYPVVYSVETGQPLSNLSQPDTMLAGCTCLRICPNNKLVAACSSDGSVKVVDLDTNQYKFRMQHKSSVVAAAFDNQSASLVTAGFRNILVWNMRTGALSHTLQRHLDFITDLRFSTCGNFLLSASLDKQIITWDYRIGASIATYAAHCPIEKITPAGDLSAILYPPENIAYLAIVRPNAALETVLKGQENQAVPEPVVQAQAFALTFSGQRAQEKSSRACVIL